MDFISYLQHLDKQPYEFSAQFGNLLQTEREEVEKDPDCKMLTQSKVAEENENEQEAEDNVNIDDIDIDVDKEFELLRGGELSDDQDMDTDSKVAIHHGPDTSKNSQEDDDEELEAMDGQDDDGLHQFFPLISYS